MFASSLLVATTLLLGQPTHTDTYFATPMFIRGSAVWVSRVSRRQLLIHLAKPTDEASSHPSEKDIVALV